MPSLESHRMSLTAVGSCRSYCFALGLFERVRLDALLKVLRSLKSSEINIQINRSMDINRKTQKKINTYENVMIEVAFKSVWKRLIIQ